MKNAKLENICRMLKLAKCPEDVFGQMFGNQAKSLKSQFRALANIIHPDRYSEKEDVTLATNGFATLKKWESLAESKINNKTYNKRQEISEILIFSNDGDYKLSEKINDGDLCGIFKGKDSKGNTILAKVARNGANNDLLINERNMLKRLFSFNETKDLKAIRHIPKLINSVEFQQGNHVRRANIFNYKPGFYSLEQIIKAFPNGLDYRDVAWMWNRMFAAIIVASKGGMVHGSITPAHVLINPKNHDGMLVDWSYATKEGRSIKAICPEYRDYYPSEIFRNTSSFGSDIYMSAMCVLKLLGGNIKTKEVSSNIPKSIGAFIRYCLIESPAHRPNNAENLFVEHIELLKSNYGELSFREFKMPELKQ